jgi:hypothetical protein
MPSLSGLIVDSWTVMKPRAVAGVGLVVADVGALVPFGGDDCPYTLGGTATEGDCDVGAVGNRSEVMFTPEIWLIAASKAITALMAVKYRTMARRRFPAVGWADVRCGSLAGTSSPVGFSRSEERERLCEMGADVRAAARSAALVSA